MDNFNKVILAFILAILPFSGFAKSYKFEYQFKPDKVYAYSFTIEQKNTLILNGIGEKNRSVLHFNGELMLTGKVSKDTYQAQFKVTQLVSQFFSNNKLISQINSKENTFEAGQLRRMINQNINFTLTTKGRIKMGSGLEAFIENMQINNSSQNVLLHTFSKKGFTAIAHYLFPAYPIEKKAPHESWQSSTKPFAYLQLNLSTTYILFEYGASPLIKSTDFIPEQKASISFSGSEFIKNMMGSSDMEYLLNPKDKLVKNGNGELKLLSDDKSQEIIWLISISQN